MRDCIEMFLEIAERQKHELCIIENNKSIQYGDFLVLVQKCASFFVQKTERPKVVIDLEQGIDAYAVILATLLVGGYYCPLSLDSPLERKQWIISQIDPDFVVKSNLSELSCQNAIEVENLFSDSNVMFSIEELRKIVPHQLAYIIYTSGSTGTPKGVMIKRDGLNKFLDWSTSEFSLTQTDRWAQYSYLSFDLSIVDIFTVLCAGATLVSINNLGSKLRLDSTINTNGITVWHSVPGIVDLLMKADKSGSIDLTNVRIMSFCGEPLYGYQLEYLFHKNPRLVIYNTYGPTEGTLFCTFIRLTNDNYKNLTGLTASIGVPIPGWSFKLLEYDEEAGTKEVVIFGDYIGAGYLNLVNDAFTEIVVDNKTQAAFVTGDLIEIKEGSYYFVGRKDKQIKRNGYRIEPDEIDYWIGQFSGQKSVTFLHNDFLYSIVEGNPIAENVVKEYLNRKIEKYKIPNFIYNIESLPRNANFKVDFIKLKKIIDDKENTDKSI